MNISYLMRIMIHEDFGVLSWSEPVEVEFYGLKLNVSSESCEEIELG